MAQKGTPERMGNVVLTYKTRICVYKCKNMGVMAHFVQLQHKIHDKNVAYENKGISIQIVNNMVQC